MYRIPALAAVAAAMFATSAAAGDFATGDATTGQEIFQKRCALCHSVDVAKPKPMGPTLAGVVGRTAGTLPKARYSPAMKASGLVWTPEALNEYLANPRKAVKGTTMAISLPKADERAHVIAYLQTLTGTPEK